MATETQALVKAEGPVSAAIEQALIGGDLSKLTPAERMSLYRATCQSLGLNPLTKPFAYILLNGKLTLYALKDCTEQLRTIHSISLTLPSREVHEGTYVVTARATRIDGRVDEATGAVPIEGLKGDAKANAMMKAETKAKRRVTLSICGLGILDESETASIRGARIEAPDDITEPQGSAEERDLVLEQKLKDSIEIANKRKEQEAAIQEKGWFKVMLEGFAGIKAEIGDAEYYRILGLNGFEHANQIPDRKTAQKVYKELGAVRSAAQSEVK